MTEPKLTKLELQIMDALWTRGSASIREIQEAFPEEDRPAYTTIQTTVYRLEGEEGGESVYAKSVTFTFSKQLFRATRPSAR